MGSADQGITELTGRYLVVPRTLSFITHEDDVLLLKGNPDKRIWPNLYNGIGGHVEPDEDIYAAALREIREETGLEVSHLTLRGIVNVWPDRHIEIGVVLFIFTAPALSQEVAPSDEGELVWVQRDRVGELELVEDLPTILPRVLAMGPSQAPFYAHYTYDSTDTLVVSFSP
jgi:8-oxo-dGTP diphosphatase